MCASMAPARRRRGHAILKAALPTGAAPEAGRRRAGDEHRRADVGHAARAPGRALPRDDRLAPRWAAPATSSRLPVVLGTIVSQTLLNMLALVILGAVMFSIDRPCSTIKQTRPGRVRDARRCSILAAVLGAPALLREGGRARPARVAPGSRRLLRGDRAVRSRARGLQAPAGGLRRHQRCSCGVDAAVGLLLRAARRPGPRAPCGPRRRRRRSCSRSTSPRCCRPRRRTSASSRPRMAVFVGATAMGPAPRRSATGSSSRPSRSSPPRHGRARAGQGRR